MPVRRSPPHAAGSTLLVVAMGLVACTGGDGASPTSPPSMVTTTTEPARVDDGILKIGLLLPQTGEGATIGQPLIEAAELARDRINAAGGVRGREMELVEADEGATPAAAIDAIATLQDEDVDAVVGPASSTIALATLDDLLADGFLTCSPTATALALDDFPRSELFFRTAPSDSLQAEAMALLAEQTGAQTVAVVYLDDVYGRPLASAVIAALQQRRLTVTEQITFVGSDQTLVDEATAIGQSEAGVVILIGDAEQGTRMLTAIGETAGRFSQSQPPDIIVNDAIRRPPSPQLIQSLPTVVRERIEGVSPSALPQRPEEPAGLFATNAYDCVNLIALAVAQGGSDAPADMAAQLSEVSARGQGCAEYDECLHLLADSRNIDYEGPGGSVQIGSAGDPERARFDVFGFDANGVDTTSRPLMITG